MKNLIQIIKFPSKKVKEKIVERMQIDMEFESKVKLILSEVKENGDDALFKFSKQFDKVEIANIEVSQNEIMESDSRVPKILKDAIKIAKDNIEKFHKAQKSEVEVIETTEGVKCWRKDAAIEKVGLYIPGGTAPLFSTVLMLGVLANLAGCKEIILCTPPSQNGEINPIILYVSKLLGITKIFKIGGAQAIAAMAYGTSTITKVNKIFGPGNQWVTLAKMLVGMEGVAIDMPAGPSEVMVVADESADPEFIASDLLSQAEHGVDSQAILLTTSEEILTKTILELKNQIELLPRQNFILKSLENSKLVLLKNNDKLIDLMNDYASEHLIISMKNAEKFAENVVNAGSVFIGNYSPESAGDYASGTNHTLPTSGFAKSYSGVSLDSFYKKITFQNISPKGLRNIGNVVEIMAEAEELFAHKNAISIRLKKIRKDKL